MKPIKMMAIAGALTLGVGALTSCSDGSGSTEVGSSSEQVSAAGQNQGDPDACTYRSNNYNGFQNDIAFPSKDRVTMDEIDDPGANFCIPGVGNRNIGDVDLLELFAVKNNKDVDLQSWKVVRVGTEWRGLIMAWVRTPSSGLNPGSETVKLATVDLINGEQVGKVVDLEGTNFSWMLPNRDLVVVVGGSTGITGKPDLIKSVDMITGKELWRHENAANADSNPNSVMLSNSFTFYELKGRLTNPNTGKYLDSECSSVVNVDVATGETNWAYTPEDPDVKIEDDSSLNRCARIKSGGATYGGSYHYVAIQQNPWEYTDELREIHRFQSMGNPGRENYLAVNPTEYQVEFRDPVGELSAFDLIDRSNYSKGDLIVVDRDTDQVVFTLPEKQAQELGARIRSIFDGKLYIENQDGKSIIDARTGEDTGQEWTRYPVGKVNGYTIFGDGSVSTGDE